MRGRNPEKPSERGKSNGKYKQRLEINENEMSNTITSVQKDNLVIEPKIIKEGNYSPSGHNASSKVNANRISPAVMENHETVTAVVEPLNPYKDGTCRTIKAQYQQSSRANFARQDGLGATGVVEDWQTVPGSKQHNFRGHAEMRYRIRKLTPRECFRLMDVDENVIDTIQAAGISNSQQYKLAGNSIVVACLEKIFEQMFFPQHTNSRTLFG